MYHRFGAQDAWRGLGATFLEAHIKTIRKNFNTVSLKELCTRLRNGDIVLPNTVVFTVDDGYRDFYHHAYPIFRKYDVPATVYVTTDFVDRKVWLWPDVIQYILDKTGFQSYTATFANRPISFSLIGEGSKRLAWNDIADYCLTLKNNKREGFIDELANDLKVVVPDTPTPKYEALSWDQIREMKQHKIDFGSHTCTHPRLVMTEGEALHYEIEGSKRRIEEMIGERIDSFCYPNGTRKDFDEKIKEIVKNSGYRCATMAYWDSKPDDLFELGRYGVGSDMQHFEKVIYGMEFVSTLVRKKLRENP
jgi:peptidoglycan/xylan/chitin deacetylase (PgdA/CDA1 family)